VSTEAPEIKLVFALLHRTKAREATLGPIESLHPSIKAVTSVSDDKKHAPVNPMSDIVYEETKIPGWRGAQ
jgi:hypothetical protein